MFKAIEALCTEAILALRQTNQLLADVRQLLRDRDRV